MYNDNDFIKMNENNGNSDKEENELPYTASNQREELSQIQQVFGIFLCVCVWFDLMLCWVCCFFEKYNYFAVCVWK